MSPGPYTGLTGPWPRDPTTGALVVSGLSSRVVSASGDATGATDKAALNAALALAGTVRGVPGSTYTINGPLVIGSSTTLDMVGCTINLASGSNSNMLIDSAHNAGTLTVPSPMVDIEVRGGTWNRGANSGSGLSLHSLLLGGQRLKVRDINIKSTAGKYGLNIQNATNFTISNVQGLSHASDLIHISGPCSYGMVSNVMSTNNGDDTFAITTIDQSQYQFGNEGDVTDIEVDGVYGIEQATANIVGIYTGHTGASTPLNTRRVRVRNVRGTLQSTALNAVYLGDFSTSPVNLGLLDDIEIDGLDAAMDATASGVALVNIMADSAAPASTVAIPKVTIRNAVIRSDTSALVASKGTINCLVIDGVRGTTSTASFGGGGAMVLLGAATSTATINRLYLSNIDVMVAGSAGGSLVKAQLAGQAIGEIHADRINVANFFALFDLNTTTNLHVSNVSGTSTTQLLNLRAAAVVKVVGWSGVSLNTTLTVYTAGCTLESLSGDFPVDISNAAIVKNNGNKCIVRVTNGAVVAGSEVEYFTTGAHWYDRRGNASTA